MSADLNGTESGKTKARHGITKAGAVIIITACLLLAAVISVCGYLVLGFNAVPSGKRIVYYDENGIYEYFPESGKSDRITVLKNDFYDRSQNSEGAKTIADMVKFSADGKTAFFMKDFKTSNMFYKTGSLFSVDLTAAEGKRKDNLIADNAVDYDILAGDRLLYADADGRLYTESFPDRKKNSVRMHIASNVRGFYLNTKRDRIFWYTDSGAAYTQDFDAGTEKIKVADGVKEVRYAEGDLSEIYYINSSSDLISLKNLQNPLIVDTDISDMAVIHATGHVYYLKFPVQHTEEDAGEEYSGSAGYGEYANPAGSSGGKDNVASAGSAAEKAASAEQQEVSGSLGYFDGENHKIILQGVLSMNTSTGRQTKKDRILAEGDSGHGYAVYLIRDDKALDTGLNFKDKSLTDVSPDYADDVLYYIKQAAEDIGKLSKGTLYSRTYGETAFTGEPVRLYDGATIIASATSGVVFTAAFDTQQGGAKLYRNGELLDEHVSSFYRDNEDSTKNISLYSDVYQDSTFQSGKLVTISGEGGKRTIAYNVSVCNSFKDGSYTCLTNYDEEEGKGGLLYWDGTGEAKEIAEDVTGTTRGDMLN